MQRLLILFTFISITSFSQIIKINNAAEIATTEAGTSFELEVYNLPEIVSPLEFKQCDDDTDNIALMDLTLANSFISANHSNENFTFFTTELDAENNNIAASIPNPTNYVSGDNTIWVRVENQHSYKVGQINIDVTVSNTAFNSTIKVCDDFIDDTNNDYDGISEFDLTQFTTDILANFDAADRPDLLITFYPTINDAQLQSNIISNPQNYRNTNPNTSLLNPERIFIRVENKNNISCAGMGLDMYLDLIVHKKPFFSIDDQVLCVNSLPAEVRVYDYTKDYDYVWTDEEGNNIPTDPNFSEIGLISKEGQYTVTATDPNPDDPNNTCVKTKIFNVQMSSVPTVETVTVFDNLPNNKISIIVSGLGDYEFSIDNGSYVDANNHNGHVFYNVIEGAHIIRINDKNGCTPIIEREVVVIRFPRYISSNHDGVNDEFYVYGGDDLDLLSVTIFDRYGKVITVLNQNQRWDGTYLGKIAAKADYWFLAKFIDRQGRIYEREGHFSIVK